MDKIKETDSRIIAIAKFDAYMDELFIICSRSFNNIIESIVHNRITSFVRHIERLELNTRHTEAQITLYSNCIENSLLSVRYNYHLRYHNHVKHELCYLRDLLSCIYECDRKDRWFGNSDIDETDALDLFLKNDFNDIVISKIECILNSFSILGNGISRLCGLHGGRVDTELENIYIEERKAYCDSEEWEGISTKYVKDLYNNVFCSDKVESTEFDKIILVLHQSIEEDDDFGGIYQATTNNDIRRRAKLIYDKQWDTYTELHRFFRQLEKMNLVRQWKDDHLFETEGIESPDCKYNTNSVVFIGEWTLEKFLDKWDDIYKYMRTYQTKYNMAAYGWCCLQHAMSIQQIIEKTSFPIFMRWLMDVTGVSDLMTESNIRTSYSQYYYPKEVNKQWSAVEMFKTYKKTKQAEDRFILFERCFNGMRNILYGRPIEED